MGPPPSKLRRSGRNEPGRQSSKGYPSSGGVPGPPQFRNCGPGSIVRSGVGPKAQLRPRPSLNSARYQASAVAVGSGSDCGETARERARLGLRRVGCDAASTTSGGMIRFDSLLANSHGRFWRYGCRRSLRLWFTTQTKLLRQGRSPFCIRWGRQRMTDLQTPAYQIFLPAPSVSGVYVAA
jgi:hypothetical protein